jgi:HTH-type transcriptional regulator / antitoxin HipB
MQISLHFGASIVARRRHLGLRQDEVAELAGCSVRFLHALEHDKPSVALDKVLDVLEVLGLTLEVVAIQPQHSRTAA